MPSVTLWDAPELDRFVELFLKFVHTANEWDSPEVVIVPDADAYNEDHELVRQQALFFRTYLERKGLSATIAAPPSCDFTGMHSKCTPGEKCKANGVDDFLARGGKLSELVVLRRELPTEAFDAWALEQRFKYGHRSDRIRTDRTLLEGLSLHGRDTFTGWLPQIAKATGLGRSTAYDAAHRLIEAGVITTDKPLDLTQRQFKTKDGKTMTPFDFEDAVTFTIPAELRCAPDTFHPLGPKENLLTTTDYHREHLALQRKQLDKLESIDRRLSETYPTGKEVTQAVDAFVADALTEKGA